MYIRNPILEFHWIITRLLTVTSGVTLIAVFGALFLYELGVLVLNGKLSDEAAQILPRLLRAGTWVVSIIGLFNVGALAFMWAWALVSGRTLAAVYREEALSDETKR